MLCQYLPDDPCDTVVVAVHQSDISCLHQPKGVWKKSSIDLETTGGALLHCLCDSQLTGGSEPVAEPKASVAGGRHQGPHCQGVAASYKLRAASCQVHMQHAVLVGHTGWQQVLCDADASGAPVLQGLAQGQPLLKPATLVRTMVTSATRLAQCTPMLQLLRITLPYSLNFPVTAGAASAQLRGLTGSSKAIRSCTLTSTADSACCTRHSHLCVLVSGSICSLMLQQQDRGSAKGLSIELPQQDCFSSVS